MSLVCPVSNGKELLQLRFIKEVVYVFFLVVYVFFLVVYADVYLDI